LILQGIACRNPLKIPNYVLRLKLANPDRVFLLRGNHEEISMGGTYGFFSEGIFKYGSAFDVAKVARLTIFCRSCCISGRVGIISSANMVGWSQVLIPGPCSIFPLKPPSNFLAI
jgi:hypothetical protein